MTDEELGIEFLRGPWNDPKWYESDSPRDAMVRANHVQVGAMVRLLREALEHADEIVESDGDLGNDDAVRWVTEARKLVGKVT
jgi:hypothetical protein